MSVTNHKRLVHREELVAHRNHDGASFRARTPFYMTISKRTIHRIKV